MFIDPSMGGKVYNPWLAQSNILQRFGEANPTKTVNQPAPSASQGQTNYRFFGSAPQQSQGEGKYQVFRSFF